MKKIKVALAGIAIIAAGLVLAGCDDGSSSYDDYYSYYNYYTFPGIKVTFENGYTTDTFGTKSSTTDPSIPSEYTVTGDSFTGILSWSKFYEDAAFTKQITSFTKYMTIKSDGDTTQTGNSDVMTVYVKDSDLSVSAQSITLSVYSSLGTLTGTTIKTSGYTSNSSFYNTTEFADSMEDYADSTHYYTALYTDSLLTTAVAYPLSVKDVFCKSFKLYADAKTCSDKAYVTVGYSGIKLTDEIPATVKDITVAPPHCFATSAYDAKAIANFQSKYLENIAFADGYTKIVENAFTGNKSLETVTGLDSVTAVENYEGYSSLAGSSSGAFSGCTSLKKISLPSASLIGAYSFYNNTVLEKADLSAAVTIKDYAFYSCPKLTELDLPKSITSIGANVFNGTSLTINYAGTMAQWKNGVKLTFSSSYSTYSKTTSEASSYYTVCSFPSGTVIKCTDGTLTYTNSTNSFTVTESVSS